MMGAANENGTGDTTRRGDYRSAAIWKPANDLSRVQFGASEENGPLSERNVHGRWCGLALLALSAQRGGLL